MSTPVYEAVAYTMRYWFIAVACGILIAMIVASYRTYKEKKTVKTELSRYLGYLEIIGGPDEFLGDRFGILEMNQIGSDESADIILPDSSVAPVHAFLYMDNGDLILEPHVKNARTQINGRTAIRPHMLKTGDVIAVGDVEFAVYIKRTRLGYDH